MGITQMEALICLLVEGAGLQRLVGSVLLQQ